MPRMASREGLVRTLGQSLEARDSRLCVYLTAYPEEDEGFFDQALREARQANPALPRPELTVELYPDAGTRRVAVLTLDYGEDVAGPDGLSTPPEQEGAGT